MIKKSQRGVPRRHARGVASVAVALVIPAAVSGCSGSDSAAGDDGGTYVVGASLPLSGPTTVYGANLAGGMEAYFNYVNEQGGVNGKEIKLVSEDGGFDTATTVQSLKRLAQEKPIVFGGLLVGSATEGALSTIASLEVPALVASPTTSINRPPANPYVFGAGGTIIEDEAFMLADFAKADLIESGKSPRVVTVNHISSGGEVFSDNIKKIAEESGWEFVGDESYTVGTTNFDAQAAKIASYEPDYIFMAPDSSGQNLIKALKGAGVTATILSATGSLDEQQIKDLDYPSLYVGRGAVFAGDGSQAATEFTDRVSKVKGNVDPNFPITQFGYLQAEVIVKVLEECGADCDSESFLETITSMGTIDTDGFTFGPVTYTEESTAGLTTDGIYRWNPDSGEVEPVPNASYSYTG